MKNSVPVVPCDHYFQYEEMIEIVRALAEARPDLCRLSSIGSSFEGKDIPLLVITDYPSLESGGRLDDRLEDGLNGGRDDRSNERTSGRASGSPECRPGYLLFGGIHAHEPGATHAPLYVARELMAGEPDILKEVTFYIIPRLTVDATDFVVRTSARLRSRGDWINREPNTLYQEDVDGNGLILTMRQWHPEGDLTADPEEPRLLIKRRADSPPPYYRSYPEGTIHQWDGSDSIKPAGLDAWFGWAGSGGRSFDWNRNWSWNWSPENVQQGSGDFPFSEKEIHQLAGFMHEKRNLFGIMSFHCGYASILRPPSSDSGNLIDETDDRTIQEIALMGQEELGFGIASNMTMHRKDQRPQPKSGHFMSFSYHHLGLIAYEIELGYMGDEAGVNMEEMHNSEGDEPEKLWMRKIMKWWDAHKDEQPLFEDWKPFEHPQLGPVEIGGFLYSHLDNPAFSRLPRILEGVYRFAVKHAEQHPRVCLEDITTDQVEKEVYRVRARVANRGRLPTNVTNQGAGIPRLLPVQVYFYPAEGTALLSREGHRNLGHLAGVNGCRDLEWFVSGSPERKELCEIVVSGGTGGNIRQTVLKEHQ